MANSDVVLLDYWPSPFGTRVRIALAEKGISYKPQYEDLANKSPLLLKMNPTNQTIPVLIHNGNPVRESGNIIQYIDEVWKENPPLSSPDPYQRAGQRLLVDFIDKKVHGSSVKVWMGTAEDKEVGKNELVEWSKFLDHELGDKSYFGGETFGFVDIALVPFYNWFRFFKSFADLDVEPVSPRLVQWFKRCTERTSVAKSLPDSTQIYEAYLEFNDRVRAVN